jgi:SEC-C motif
MLAKPGRNDPCRCGSGRKYKKCCLGSDRQAERAMRAALPELKAAARRLTADIERGQEWRRQEYGVYVNYVSPVEYQGRRVWSIGTRLYLDRPQNETFHEFLLHVLRGTLGNEWREAEMAKPEDERHFVMKCFEEYDTFTREAVRPENEQAGGRWAVEPNGYVLYLLSLAWDVASLIHASNLPQSLISRLQDSVAYQGARYEIGVVAVFARLDCEVRFLDEEEELRGRKHVEFVALHRPTGQEVAVEAKSRHRAGVVNQPGQADPDDPLRGDARAIRGLYMAAVEKAPEDMPFIVFIDVNAPLEPDAEALDKQWMQDIKRWMGRLPLPAPEEPDVYNALYVTNFAPHYRADELASTGEWAAAKPLYVKNPLVFDLTEMVDHALNNYLRVPEIGEGGEVLE